MPTRNDLKELAKLRLAEAETLYHAGYYDGATYLCGYAVEFALKATLDTAVNTSPFLANKQRADIMSIRYTKQKKPR
jgi:hypothetical protein